MTRTHHCRVWLILALILTVALSTGNQGWAETGKKAGSNKVVGSYLLEVLHEGFPPAQALVALTRDGTFQSIDTSDLGAGGLTTRDSPVIGTWRKAGGRKVRARTLYFAYDEDGIPIWQWRSDGTFRFDPGFQTGSGTLTVSKFALDQNPLDPAEEPLETLDATLTAQRITVP